MKNARISANEGMLIIDCVFNRLIFIVAWANLIPFQTIICNSDLGLETQNYSTINFSLDKTSPFAFTAFNT